MPSVINLRRTRTHLTVALGVVPHDRWVLGGLRDGRLRVLAEWARGRRRVPTEGERTIRVRSSVRPIYTELSPLARRCLFERHPLCVTSVADGHRDDVEWETEWPSVLYVPVGLPSTRPVGLIIVGSRTPHWYTQDEIDFVAALGVSMTATVSAVTGPLGRLTPRERRFALLIAEGLSDEEIAHALELDDAAVRRASDTLLRKLALRSRYEVRDLVPGLAAARPEVLEI